MNFDFQFKENYTDKEITYIKIDSYIIAKHIKSFMSNLRIESNSIEFYRVNFRRIIEELYSKSKIIYSYCFEYNEIIGFDRIEVHVTLDRTSITNNVLGITMAHL